MNFASQIVLKEVTVYSLAVEVNFLETVC